MSQFLCYGLIDPRTNELRYVGKSSSGLTRPNMHRVPSGRRGHSHRCAWLRQMWEDGEHLPCVIVLQECEDDAQALANEIVLIALFRAAGFNLTNLTDGGDGTRGYVGHRPSPEALLKMSAAQRGRVHSAETRAKIAASNHRRKLSPETRAKIGNANRNPSPETRARLSAAHTNPPAETRAKIAAARRGTRASDAARKKMSESQKARWRLAKEAQAVPDNNQKQETP